MKNQDFPSAMEFRRNFGGGSFPADLDFLYYTDTNYFTKRLTGTGTLALGTGAHAIGGQLVFTTTVTASSGVVLYTTAANYLMSTLPSGGVGTGFAPDTGHALMCEALIQFTEVSTNQAGVFFGFNSLNTNVILVDAGLTPATNFSGAMIYKIAGETVWRAISSNGTTQFIDKSNTTSGLANFVRLRIEMKQVDAAGNYENTFYAGTVSPHDCPPMTTGSSYPIPIKHTITSTSAANMYGVLGNKTVTGTGIAEVMYADYAVFEELRG